MSGTRCLIIGTAFALSVGGCSRPRELQVSPGCETPEVIECLQRFAVEKLSRRSLETVASGFRECFAEDKRELARQSSCLPQVMGTDAQTGHAVEVRYTCSDYCPDAGSLQLIYRGVSGGEACCDAGGVPRRDAAWGGNLGCQVSTRENAKERAAACQREVVNKR